MIPEQLPQELRPWKGQDHFEKHSKEKEGKKESNKVAFPSPFLVLPVGRISQPSVEIENPVFRFPALVLQRMVVIGLKEYS